jgi:hypothetical protein
MKSIHKFLLNPFVGIIMMSLALMEFVYSFDITSIAFYLAILQSIFMEYAILWFLKKYRKG